MDKPVILCLNEDPALLAALNTGLSGEFQLESAAPADAAGAVERVFQSGRDVALVLVNGAPAPFALPALTLPESKDPATLRQAVREELLERKYQAMYERAETLESMNDVGVTLSGSFDIKEILATMHDAAGKIASADGVDVLYFGCSTIHSRALWHPAEPSRENIDATTRLELLELATRSGDSAPALGADGRQAFPISYQDEQLGVLFVSSGAEPGMDTTRLLSILTLQAATALRNIHLTQERIQFERLSAIGRMIGSVVHDFRGPLTALRGFAGMLTNQKLNSDDRASYGQYMVEECDRLNGMVEELLEFTRGGNFTLKPERTELGSYIDAVAERMRVQFGSRFAIELKLDYGGPVHIDPQRMERALWNLATNAVQAMPKGGRLVIRSVPAAKGMVLSIEDNGPGIPVDVRHRIFEPFFSFGKSEGIGLGMLIARKIVEAHGGTLEVESSADGGTAVHLRLPVQDNGIAREWVEAEALDPAREPQISKA